MNDKNLNQFIKFKPVVNENKDDKVQVICGTIGSKNKLKTLICSLKCQTINDWFLRIIHCGCKDNYKYLKQDLEKEGDLNEKITIEFNEEGSADNSFISYGLKNQNKTSEWTIVTEEGAYYMPNAIESILSCSSNNKNLSLIHWDFMHKLETQEKLGPKMNYIVLKSKMSSGEIDVTAISFKTKFTKKITLNSIETEEGEAYINECVRLGRLTELEYFQKEWLSFLKITQPNQKDPPIAFIDKLIKNDPSTIGKIDQILTINT